MYQNPWIYKDKPFDNEDIPEGVIGFVYVITNKKTSRKYIGRKILIARKKKVTNGKTKRIIVDSNWQKYYGSSAEMINDVLTFGEESFIREILYLCKSKSVMAYLELKEIMARDALIKDEYINKWITAQINGKNLKELK